jgi:crossover junction endodeoxyribonuclease RuvC
MAVLGIDPSLTGFALRYVARGGELAHQIKTKSTDFPCFPARLDFIEQEFSRFLLSLEERIELVAIEGFSFGSRGGTMQSEINGLGQTIRLALWRRGLSYVEVPPSTLKKWISGKGNAEKSTMMMEVLDRWGYKSTDDNDADAYALARLAERWLAGNQKAADLWKAVQGACVYVQGRAG